jgi:predicted nucleic acid-binding Zn ribbon protein
MLLIKQDKKIQKNCIICGENIWRLGRSRTRRSPLARTCSPKCSRIYLYKYKGYKKWKLHILNFSSIAVVVRSLCQ